MDSNQLYYGDNLDVLRNHIDAESVDLCYIDPPFNSNRNYNQIYNNEGHDDRAQVQAFTDTWEWDNAAEIGLQELFNNPRKLYTYQTVTLMEGLQKVLKKGSLLAYLVSMTLRIAEIHRVLKSTGSFYLHCDPTASHYLKLLMDTIFISQGGTFRNEIVWYYPNSGFKAKSKKFHQVTDTIFCYTKSKNFIFNPIYKEIEATKQAKRKFNSATKKADVVRDEFGKPIYVVRTQALENSLWRIPMLNTGKERLDYPTQKPEKLLENILKSSSSEGDTVLDAYCGCGTTVAVAQRLGRRWIGIDITYASISVILERLEKTYGAEVVDKIALGGIPKDIESARALAHKKDDRTRKEFEKWAILTYSNNRAYINEKKGKDKGIDGIAKVLVNKGEGKEVLFSVKSGHISSAQVRDLRGAIEREDAAAGIFITLEPPTKDMLQEAKAAGIFTSPVTGQSIERIKIVTINQIIEGERLSLPMVIPVLK